MNKNNTYTPLTDDYLQSVAGMQIAATDDWFYARLRAKMECRQSLPEWSFRLKPVWVIGALTGLLLVNAWMLGQRIQSPLNAGDTPSAEQLFVQEYNIPVPSND